MQQKPELPKPSTSTSIPSDGNLQTLQTPQKGSSTSGKWFHSITELPLSKYIDCAVDENIYALVISGHPTREELEHAWLDITGQYADAMGDNERGLIVKLYSEITQISILWQQAVCLVDILNKFKYQKFEKLLNSILNQKFKFTDEKRRDELQKCTKLCKGFELRIMAKRQQLDGLTAKNAGEAAGKLTREYFHSALITISDFSKFHISENITTFEFCERIRRITEYARVNKTKPNGPTK